MSKTIAKSEQSALLGDVSGGRQGVSWEQQKHEKARFSSGIGLVLACLGSTVGTGNIWRYPRIVAIHAAGGGALVFLIVWFCFLWLWSIPLIILEYATGRYTRLGTVESMNELAGPSFRFMGAWLIFVPFAISCYYSVLIAWCFYYFIFFLANDLPLNVDDSYKIWNDLQDSHWPVWCHLLSMLLASLSVIRGVSTIEPINKVVVPILLAIILFSFYWAIFLPYADVGIEKFFSPNWDSLTDSKMWLDAVIQNAWDTGGAACGFWTYAIYMERTSGVVRIGTLIPIGNNFVSLLCGITVFCCAFSVLLRLSYSTERILTIIGDNGPANTGLTFIWMPMLYNNISGGRFLCALFFICISLAGFSSMISLMERTIRVSIDFGIRRVPATIFVGLATFFIGLGSAFNINILINQDTVWGYALMISGLFCVFMVYRFGGERYRKEVVNKSGIGDWRLPRIWTITICILTPLQAIGILIWYIVREIIENEEEKWYRYSRASLIMVLTQWAIALLILIGLNWWLKPFECHFKDPRSWFNHALKLLIRQTAIKQQHSYPTPQLSHDFTPLSSENSSDRMVGYYRLSKSDPSSSDRTDSSSGKETYL